MCRRAQVMRKTCGTSVHAPGIRVLCACAGFPMHAQKLATGKSETFPVYAHTQKKTHMWTSQQAIPGLEGRASPVSASAHAQKIRRQRGVGPDQSSLLLIHILFHTAPFCCVSPCDLLKNEKVIWVPNRKWLLLPAANHWHHFPTPLSLRTVTYQGLNFFIIKVNFFEKKIYCCILYHIKNVLCRLVHSLIALLYCTNKFLHTIPSQHHQE